jgi:predicted transcriptional regulator
LESTLIVLGQMLRRFLRSFPLTQTAPPGRKRFHVLIVRTVFAIDLFVIPHSLELMMAETEKPDLTNLTVQLLSAYVSNNTLPSGELASLIKTTREALEGDQTAAESAEPEFAPAVSARKSLASRDHIVSMIDGKPYKSLKRHLSSHGLSPEEYRARYHLPNTYPMVAPAYSEQRREVARRLGLGRRKTEAAPATEVSAAAPSTALIGSAPKPSASRKARSPSKVTPSASAESAPAKTAKPRTRAASRGKEEATITPEATKPRARRKTNEDKPNKA